MEKLRFKVTLNWQGQVFEFYREATSAEQALLHSIRALAYKVGYTTRYVKGHIMTGNRYEVSK